MQQNIPQISVDDEDVGNNEWHAPDNETYSYVWVSIIIYFPATGQLT